MAKEEIKDIIPRICECGHRSDEHRGGMSDCTAAGCKCDQFHEASDGAFDKTCTECGRNYRCSVSKESGAGICNICVKKIERAYAGDTMQHLFGWKDDRKSQLYAKKLATTISKAGLTIEKLYEFYQKNNPQ